MTLTPIVAKPSSRPTKRIHPTVSVPLPLIQAVSALLAEPVPTHLAIERLRRQFAALKLGPRSSPK